MSLIQNIAAPTNSATNSPYEDLTRVIAAAGMRAGGTLLSWDCLNTLVLNNTE
tara:strand:- start:7892 stop:8050 length:159 start_codon:yes stop_codon:yes gene_type:complete